MNYDFEFWRWNFPCDKFTSKQSSMLQTFIGGTRINSYLKFSSYATLTFNEEDKEKRFPHIEEIPEFNRNKTSCLIYDIVPPEGQLCKYNKCFIMQYIGKHKSFYSFILFNEENKDFFHKYFIEYDKCDLAISLASFMKFE